MGTSRSRLFVACAIACALAVLPAPAAADQDLKSLLVDPPTTDWVEAGATPTVLVGPFTADSYGAYIQAAGGTAAQAADTVNALHRYGMTGGYSREWEQRGSGDVIVERVFAFRDTSGADFWYSGVKLDSQTSKDFVSDITGLDAIPNSFGVVLKPKDSATRQFRVDFKTADYVFIIHTDSDTSDLTNLAISQATKVYATANGQALPSPSPAGNSGGLGTASRAVTVAIIATGSLLLAAVIIGAGLLLMGRRKKPAVATPFQMSPDRAFWWDGAQWQSAETSTPPQAQRTPDGTSWWDGATWRPVR
ncbi:MAG TPA: hypothetical protein VFL29_08650 [Candidatus Dormibacteraeota bacterium]|nr:hypothetical protein [Candidatus Dormibacteraeota bacterium]